MEIKLHGKDRIRTATDKGKLFVDTQCGEGETSIGVEFYNMFLLQLRSKDGFLKMFSFRKDVPVNEVDFGWWHDGKILWSNSEQNPEECDATKAETTTSAD